MRTPTITDRAAAALELARVLDAPTVARLIEAAELHAHDLDRLDDRVDTGGEFADDVRRLRHAAVFLREVNRSRPMLKAPAGLKPPACEADTRPDGACIVHDVIHGAV